MQNLRGVGGDMGDSTRAAIDPRAQINENVLIDPKLSHTKMFKTNGLHVMQNTITNTIILCSP